MSPRPALLPISRPKPCRLSTLPPLRLNFHSSQPRQNEDDSQTHYEVLKISPTADQAEIKRQFYTLSKLHHPDHNPSDPHASSKFARLSTAYHTLGDPSKRRQYDRDHLPQHPRGSPPQGQAPHHSYSSSSSTNPAGGRPASGLSRRRAQFRGPPPSFYRNGGWGEHSQRRADAAASGRSSSSGPENPNPSTSRTSSGPHPEFSSNDHWEDEEDDYLAPHFNRRQHLRTHEQQDRRRRRRVEREFRGPVEEEHVNGAVFNFVVVSSVVGLAVLVPSVLVSWGS